jgi:nitroreductase
MYSKEFEAIIQRRRSNRKFDPNVKVPEEVMHRSLQRTILSPNSSNMQLWEFYWIHSEEEKKKFIPLCLGQAAAKTAQEMVVFVTRQDLWKKRAQFNINRIKENIKPGEEPNPMIKNGLKYYGKLMPVLYKNDIFGFYATLRRMVCLIMGINKPFMRFGGHADQRVMVHKSCALAAQTFMLSIAAEGFESCPMEGFDQIRVKKALGLSSGAEINMIISVGKGTEEGIWGPRYRVPYEEVVFEK